MSQGRTGAKKRGKTPSRARKPAPVRIPQTEGSRFRLPDGSRSVASPWVWRGFVLMAFIALGICLSLFLSANTTFGALWAIITVGWLGIGMWLWRQHHVATS